MSLFQASTDSCPILFLLICIGQNFRSSLSVHLNLRKKNSVSNQPPPFCTCRWLFRKITIPISILHTHSPNPWAECFKWHFLLNTVFLHQLVISPHSESQCLLDALSLPELTLSPNILRQKTQIYHNVSKFVSITLIQKQSLLVLSLITSPPLKIYIKSHKIQGHHFVMILRWLPSECFRAS